MCPKRNSTFTAAISTGTVRNSINNLSTAGHLTFPEPNDSNWNVMDSDKLGSVFKISVTEGSWLEYLSTELLIYSHTGLAYQIPKGWYRFLTQTGPRKRGTTALYPIPTPEEKLNEQTPEPCTWKITAHCWHGGQQANLGYYQDTTRPIWTSGAFSLFIRAPRTGRHVTEASTHVRLPPWEMTVGLHHGEHSCGPPCPVGAGSTEAVQWIKWMGLSSGWASLSGSHN